MEVYRKVGLIMLLFWVCIFYSYLNVWSLRCYSFSNVSELTKSNANTYLLASSNDAKLVNNTKTPVCIWKNSSRNTLKVTKILSVENSRFTVATKGAILWTHFLGGLTNQRLRMKDGIYLTATLKRPFVLPSWVLVRPKFGLDYHEIRWKKIPIIRVYDVEYLILCLAKLNIKALYPCLPDTCVPGFVPPRLTHAAIQKGQNISLPFVVADFDPLIFTLPPRQSAFRHKIDACITWSSEIKSLGQTLIEQIKIISGSTNLSNVFGLHLRVENDFLTHIILGKLYREKNYTVTSEVIREEITNGALDCFNSHLKYVNFSQSWVYIATGEPKNSSKFTSVIKYFPFVITKDSLSQACVDFELDFRAAIDSFILEQLPFFVGFSESTLSTQVAQNRRLKYLPSALYDLRTSRNCTKFYIWENW